MFVFIFDPLTHLFSFSSVSNHSTSKLTWAECLDFNHTAAFIVDDLRGLKRFLNGGLFLRVEEEKVQKLKLEEEEEALDAKRISDSYSVIFQVLSWPSAPEDVAEAKSSQSVKEKKGGKGKDVRSSK